MTNMNYQTLLEKIQQQVSGSYGQGKVASYIPELGKVNGRQFGMSLYTLDGQTFSSGDSTTQFSIQSISKVLSLALAFRAKGDDLWNRVGVEPSGDPFNSLIQLEAEKGLPRNPLINAGAIVITDVLLSIYDDPLNEILEFIREMTESPSIDIDVEVAESEARTGDRNRAMGYFLKSYGRINHPVEKVLDVYFKLCAIEMNCEELARSFLFLANHGYMKHNNSCVLSSTQAKRVNSIMQTCGFYDQAGEFTYKVGLPGKSGVGGGIAAIVPGSMSLAVWSPELNPYGNSVLGMQALELFTTETNLSIF